RMVCKWLTGLVRNESPTSSQPKSNKPAISILSSFSSHKKVFLEFSIDDKNQGRIEIEVLPEGGIMGEHFIDLITGEHGYGYQGSRIYACCTGEWCLLGDLLYCSPVNEVQQPAEAWAQPQSEHGEVGPVEETKPKLRKVYRGHTGCDTAQESPYDDQRGTVTLVAHDLDLDTKTWTLGPQFKIALKDNLVRSGRVLGNVVQGLDVLDELSQLPGSNAYEPHTRITIANCGVL
ncbi:unnamed protein product, partial [Meganyctiphanes norvegica]